MSEQTAVHIMIFQAPFASLIEQGLYLRMYGSMDHFCGPVPAEYYLVAFDGEIGCPPQLPKDGDQRIYAIIGGLHLFQSKNIRIDNAYTLQYNQGGKDGDGHARRCELVNSAGLHAQGTGGRDPGRCGPHDVRSVYHAA